MLHPHVLAAVFATINLDGAVVDDGSDYAIVEFDVPAGTLEIEIAHTADETQNILDWGVWDPNGFRGWGGGLRDNAIIGETEASRGYIPGPLPVGTWHLVIGKADIRAWPATYALTVDLKDAETLTARERAPFTPVILASERRYYAGDFHVHSRESGDATASFAEIAALARERGLDFVALSDHNTVAQHPLQAAYQAGVTDVLFIRGAEVTTYSGHGNAFGFTDYIDHRVGLDTPAGTVSAASIVADVRAQGGLFSINHPRLNLGNACIGCAWDHADTPWQDVQAMEIHTGNYDATISLFTPLALALWDEKLAEGLRITAIGGSDDHRAGMDLSPMQSPIGSPATVVLADELSEAAILEAVAAGRVVVKLRGPDDPDLRFTATSADDADGATRVDMGETIATHQIALDVEVDGGTGFDVLIVRNGEAVDIVAIDSDAFAVRFSYDIAETGDRFRAHVVQGGVLDVVVSNHIYAEYAEPPPGAASDCGCRVGAARPASSQSLAAFALLMGLFWLALRRRGQTARAASAR